MDSAKVLDGKVSIVTGGAQGIGRGIALVLANAGSRVVIGDLNCATDTTDEINAAGGSAKSMVMDISEPLQCKNLVEFAESEFGTVDILVNNAAIDAPDGNAWDLPVSDWDRTISVNLSGAFYCSQAALQVMQDSGSGCIVNISSQSARHGSKGLSPAYNASKAGLLGLTTAFAAQVTEKGIRVNAVLPALVESRDFGWDEETRARESAPYPLGLGTPEDIGHAVLYLVSPTSKWVSGTALHVTGGSQRGSSVL